MSTFCDISGREIPEFTDGKSLRSLLKGEGEELDRPLYWEFYEGKRKPKRAVIMGDWKLLAFNFTEGNEPEFELYNIKEDISEQNNLAESNTKKVQELYEIMIREHNIYPNRNYKAK